MSSLAEKLSQHVGLVFKSCDLPEELGRVQVSDRPDLAQFQCNGAMAAAKIAKKAPRDIANDIVSKLKEDESLSKVDIAGPGFINLDVTDTFIAQHMASLWHDERLGVKPVAAGQTMILDYGGPNVAKPMHVGHLRASIIGDTLRRICSFMGYETLGDVHMGDWGTHMGMIISEYIATGREDEVLNVDLEDRAAVAALMNQLSDLYPQVSGKCKEDPERLALAQDATVKIQNKDPQHFRLWEKIRNASIIGMRENFARLNVHFDLWKGEADVHDYIAPMVQQLKDDSFAEKDQGALIVRVANDDDDKEIPPLILYKRDGAVMYGTTDMATLVERVKLYNPDKVVYIVDQRQHLHFVQVFRAVKKAGIVRDDVELTHAGFGTMNGPDGKPFKTRAGGVMKLEDLISEATDKALQRLDEAALAQDMSDDEKNEVAHSVAISAIKFADLQNQRQSDYIFDLDRFARFEGKTGPYLLYQAVRIQSLLAKAQTEGVEPSGAFVIEDVDRPLALLLTEMPDVFELCLKSYAPHHLCEYAYRLAQEFSRFYGSCHILSEDNQALKESRLGLCVLALRQITLILDCLGIDIPKRM